ncbi:MAG: HD domain-containing protein [Patescibacteria group bacterium]|nr:HD domain-containing protein [Patescibacteria group bacterium]
MKIVVPEEIIGISAKLMSAGHVSFLVGGSLRDLLIGRAPKDWDVATDARPEEIQKIFPGSVYENEFGTVGVKTGSEDPTLALVEVTTFRKEEQCSDFRHPDSLEFAATIEEDLARRDFTINALALDAKGNIIDPYEGIADIKKKLIRAVGDPNIRFREDALRLMRAVRLASELGFTIEKDTAGAITRNSDLLGKIAAERVRDELIKLIMSGGAKEGMEVLEKLGLLRYVLSELREGINVGQNKHHVYTVWEHNLRALDYAARKNYSLEVRLASLLHDVGKPRVKQGDGPDSTFYAHEIVGAKMTSAMLNRLRFPKKVIDHVTHLVRHHLFYYNVGEVTEAGVRRFLNRVGPENLEDLFKVREADRIGSGVPKAFPYKLRHLEFMIEKVKRDPVSPKMLAIDGNDIMLALHIDPGPRVGWILGVLLEEVLDDPTRNVREKLEARARELSKLDGSKLAGLASSAREHKEEFESGVEEEMKKKYYVK